VPDNGGTTRTTPETTVAKDGRSPMKANQSCHKTSKVAVALDVAPVQPAELVVLAVSVVIPPLGASNLVAHQQHGPALGEEPDGDKVLGLAAAQRCDGRVVGSAFHAAIPGVVIVCPIAVLLAVGLIVFLVERNKIVEREAVVRRNKVHAAERVAAGSVEESG